MKRLTFFLFLLFIQSPFACLRAQWTTQSSGGSVTPFHGIYFADKNTGWVVGGTANNPQGRKTTNGGTIWSNISNNLFISPGWYWLEGVHFSGSLNGVAVGHDYFTNGGLILYTSDGGTTWKQANTGSSGFLNCVYMATSSVVYAVGNKGTILKSTNSGGIWSAQNSGVSNDLQSVWFISIAEGWSVGTNGCILHTSNGGVTWISQNSATTLTLEDICFANSTTGWVVGANSKILKTINGGASWVSQSSPVTEYLRGVHFTDQNYGWAVGGDQTSSAQGIVIHTSDGGNNWKKQTSGTLEKLWDVWFASKDTGYAAGSGGVILKYAAAPTTGISEIEEQCHIYPNPVADMVSIHAGCKDQNPCVLLLMDINGRLIRKNNIFCSSGCLLDVGDLKTGKYFLLQEDGNKVWSIIKE